MIKSITVVMAGGLLIAAPAAMARQTAQTPAPAGTQTQAAPAAPATSAPDQAPSAPAAQAVPADMKNPVKPTPDSLARAKQIYAIDCALCHGDKGNGKTDLATSMGLTLTDFSDPKTLTARMDGELFNLIRNGKDKMPGEDKSRASDDQVWALILYVRSLGGPATISAAK